MDDMTEGDTVYTPHGVEKELDEDWEWTTETQSQPGWYGMIRKESLLDDGPVSVGLTAIELEGRLRLPNGEKAPDAIWFVADMPFEDGPSPHLAMFAGPPDDVLRDFLTEDEYETYASNSDE